MMVHFVKDPVLLSEHLYYDNGDYRPILNFDLALGRQDEYDQTSGMAHVVLAGIFVGVAITGASRVYRFFQKKKPSILMV